MSKSNWEREITEWSCTEMQRLVSKVLSVRLWVILYVCTRYSFVLTLEGFWSEWVSRLWNRAAAARRQSRSFEQTFALPCHNLEWRTLFWGILQHAMSCQLQDIGFTQLQLSNSSKQCPKFQGLILTSVLPSFRRDWRTRRPTPRRRRTTRGTTESRKSSSTQLRKWWARKGGTDIVKLLQIHKVAICPRGTWLSLHEDLCYNRPNFTLDGLWYSDSIAELTLLIQSLKMGCPSWKPSFMQASPLNRDAFSWRTSP